MGILHEDVVMISHPEHNKQGEPSIITVNCPDKTGLGCDLCRLILCFRLTILRVDVSTDGKWCYILFWVTGNEATRWSLLKRRLIEVCPSCSSASGMAFYRSELPLRPPDVFLLKFCCHDNRHGLLHDVTVVLCELELSIKRLKVSTTPEGRMVDLFFVTDTRGLLHTKKRQDETIKHLKDVGTAIVTCEIEMVGPEIAAACSNRTSFLPPEIVNQDKNGSHIPSHNNSISITMDNSLSSSHTLVQIACQDHKGLLYDIMRTLKDCSIQISHGRFMTKKKKSRDVEVDLFIMQSEGKKKIVDDKLKQKEVEYLLHEELMCPVRVAVVSRGPDTELLVANPVELLTGKGRPLVFHDITLALKLLNTGIFSAEIGRHMIGDREFEVYRVLLDEGNIGLPVPRKRIEETVLKILMGWDLTGIK